MKPNFALFLSLSLSLYLNSMLRFAVVCYELPIGSSIATERVGARMFCLVMSVFGLCQSVSALKVTTSLLSLNLKQKKNTDKIKTWLERLVSNRMLF